MNPYQRLRLRQLHNRLNRVVNYIKKLIQNILDNHVANRSLVEVERFLLGVGVMLIIVIAGLISQINGLKDYYLIDGPRPGGRYVEGIVDEMTSINPLFPEGRASSSAIELVFNGLVGHDGKGEIVPELAESWSVNGDGTVYTFKLRQNVRWHDGEPFTAHDVVFTINQIQHPDARSPLRVSFRGVEVLAKTPHTVEFKLPNPYSPFPQLLTVGIVPRHLLEGIIPERLRLVEFNQAPVGTGPFKFVDINTATKELELAKNPDYFKGAPLLERFVIRTYNSDEQLFNAYREQTVNSASNLGFNYHADIRQQTNSTIKEAPLTSQVMTFFNLSTLKDVKVRQALAQTIPPGQIVLAAGGKKRPVYSPLLPNHLGYRRSQVLFNPKSAQKLLDESGWKQKDGLRTKDGQSLSLRVVGQQSDEHSRVGNELKKAWEKLGVGVDLTLVPLAELQQSYIRPRKYDVLLMGISIGGDPDVYAYWHSSQAQDPGLNLSRYSSEVVDGALEAGRTRSDPKLRAAKYKTFQQQWEKDVPAASLYQLTYPYVMQNRVMGVNFDRLINPADRFHNVERWTINTVPVERRLAE